MNWLVFWQLIGQVAMALAFVGVLLVPSIYIADRVSPGWAFTFIVTTITLSVAVLAGLTV